MSVHRKRLLALILVATLTGCTPTSSGSEPPASVDPSGEPVPSVLPSEASAAFPTASFAGLSDEPVPDALAAELQRVLDASANGHGLTATVVTPAGIWSGASGNATADRAMVPGDQLVIASITKTIVAAQMIQLAETGEVRLDDLAADRLPPDLRFDTNGARVIDLLSMRSGIPQWVVDDAALTADHMHAWTLEEKLAMVPPDRGPVGGDWEYVGTNYLLLGAIIEQATGRSVAEVLRSGVLAGDGYERLIYQPDERPTEPMALTAEFGLTAETFADVGGGYLPSLAVASMFATDGGMAADAPSVARWFRSLCAGQIVSPASLSQMADFDERPGYGLGVIDRSEEYWPGSGALGHKGGTAAVALCFQDPVSVVVVLANAEHDVDTLAGDLVRAASNW